MHLDGSQRDEEVLSDLSVGRAAGGGVCHAPLAGSQRLDSGQSTPAWLGAGDPKLLLESALERLGPAPLGELGGLAQILSRLHALVATTQRSPQLGQRTRRLQRRVRPAKDRDGLAQMLQADLTAAHDSYRPKRDSLLSCRFDRAGELELAFGELECLGASRLRERHGQMRAPAGYARAGVNRCVELSGAT